MMTNKNKTCLLVIPGNHSQDIQTTLKLSTLAEIVGGLKKENIDVKITTFRGINH
jgi:hypothetical protein